MITIFISSFLVNMNKDNALRTLLDLKEVLDSSNVQFWISDGTHLGYYRDSDFISHDPDIDVGIFIEDWENEVLDKLKRNGFNLKWQFGLEECGLEYAIEKRGIKIDLFFFYKNLPNRNIYWHATWFGTYNTPGKFRKMVRCFYEPFELKEIEFLGYKFLAPKDTEKYIIQKYGPDWKIPKIKWDWIKDPFNSEEVGIYIEYQDL